MYNIHTLYMFLIATHSHICNATPLTKTSWEKVAITEIAQKFFMNSETQLVGKVSIY